jgi:DNA-binding transcriptional MerR regulator
VNNYREYPPGSLARVRLVQRALEVGFTLDELAQMLGERDRGGAPCHQVRELAGDKLARVEAHLEQLTELRDELRRLLSTWDDLLAKKSPFERAGLLESLAAGRKVSRIEPTITRTHLKRKKGRETLW